MLNTGLDRYSTAFFLGEHEVGGGQRAEPIAAAAPAASAGGSASCALVRVTDQLPAPCSRVLRTDANFDALVSCLPTCCGPDNPPKSPPILAGAHLMARLKATHKQHSLDACPSGGGAAGA